jgi:DNA (cytosine-5)-methyltransferase 1
MKINVIDLFAGCGGLTDGFLQTKQYNTLAAVDWELPTVKTLKNRLKTKWKYDDLDKIIHFDIQRTEELLFGFEDEKFGKSIGLVKLIKDQDVDLVVGGPPCQAYSIAGRVRDKNGMQDDYRNFLFESYVKVVDHFKPKTFVFENVEGILSAAPGGISIIDRVRKAFLEIGYEITNDLKAEALFDTSYYGVPQKRKRVIIYGTRKNSESTQKIARFYELMRETKTLLPMNSKSAFDNLPFIFPKTESFSKRVSHYIHENGIPIPPNHEPRFHSERDIKIFKILTNDIKQGINKYSSTAALIQLYREQTGKESRFHKYHVIQENKPSNTIPAHLYKDGLRHIHPDPNQARSITVREAARIQTFDDDFEFLGTKGDQYKMIGNAVPPLFSKLIASTIIKIEK